MPPSTIEATGPTHAATAPDSNSPSWFEAPMNTEFDRADAATHLVGRLQLHQCLADHHADHVGRAASVARSTNRTVQVP